MGRKSTREDKNLYQLSRESMKWSLEEASEALECISADRIWKIESAKTAPHPDEVLVMARKYRNPFLCNYYCANECAIGQEYVPEIKAKSLSSIVLEMLSAFNYFNKEKDRLIDIAADGEISEDEMSDFLEIQQRLNEFSLSIDALKLWIDNTIASKQEKK